MRGETDMEKVSFSIYQLKPDPDYVMTSDEFIFMNSMFWKSKDNYVDLEEFRKVYSGVIESDEAEATPDLLEKLYAKFNFERPEDYHTRSVSVSDVIELRSESRNGFWFVDSVGFTKLIENGSKFDFEKNYKMGEYDG